MHDGEALPVAAVDAWLKARLPLEGVPEVTQYRGGASNLTYRLKYPGRDLVLRRPPPGTRAKSAHDVAREYRVQDALQSVYPYVPRMVALCEDEAVLGAPFYVMERVEGVIARRELPSGLTPERTRRLCENAIDRFVELHRADPGPLRALGKGPGYPLRQIEGWSERYEKARTWNVPSWRKVRDWLRERVPADSAQCLIHNDYRFDNLVLDARDPTLVRGVLDWEMATIGDPLMDLGNSLAYWIEAGDGPIALAIRRQPTHAPGMLTRREVVERYLAATGMRPGDFAFHEVYGVFRLAGILQQIYSRYFHRQTRNPAFRHFWLINHYLHWRCQKLIREAKS